MKRKLLAIWHILISDTFLCFTYKSTSNPHSEYMTADHFYTDESPVIDKHFFRFSDSIYQNRRGIANTMPC